MRGKWTSAAAAFGAILLLAIFFALQWHWLNKATDAETERIKRRTASDVQHFADDMNGEFQAVFFGFQTDKKLWKEQDWNAFEDRYNRWRNDAKHPDLIKGFVYLAKDGGTAMKYDPSLRSFVSADGDAEVLSIKAKIAGDKSDIYFCDDPLALITKVSEPVNTFKSIFIRRTFTLNRDAKDAEPQVSPPIDRLIILLDREVISGKMLPELTQKYFPDGDFRVSMIDEGVTINSSEGDLVMADASASLFDLNPTNIFFIGKQGIVDPSVSIVENSKANTTVMIQKRSEKPEISTAEKLRTDDTNAQKKIFQVKVAKGMPVLDVKQEMLPQMSSVIKDNVSGSSNGWTLAVQHSAGSIEAFTHGVYKRNLLIGIAVFLLLTGAIIAVVWSAMRVRTSAQRQVDFVSSVSHEFRTPLAVIYSAGENLADGVVNESSQVEDYGELIKGEGRKLSSMVEQILRFAGAKGGKRQYRFEATEPSTVVEKAMKDCQPAIKEKGLEIVTEIQPDLPQIKADRDALASAVQNLINNAIKYSGDSKWVKVTASNGNDKVRFTVEDHGIGIDRKDLRQIFAPFYRSRQVVDAQIHGNGLGLSIVKEIADAHNAKVYAESSLARGSKFTFEIDKI